MSQPCRRLPATRPMSALRWSILAPAPPRMAHFRQRPVRPCRRFCARRQSCDAGSRARTLGQIFTMPSESRRSMAVCCPAASDERDMIALPASPPGTSRRRRNSWRGRHLTQIVKPRVEEILEMARDRLMASPFAAEPRGRIILTGGGAMLSGMADLASQISRRPIRIGRPLGIAGLAGCRQEPGLRGRCRACWSIRRWPISNISNRATRGTPMHRPRRLHRQSRTLAAGELLMITLHHSINPDAGRGPANTSDEREGCCASLLLVRVEKRHP